MKKYNITNYVRYKNDLKESMPDEKSYDQYNREEMIVRFMPLVENIARKFATSQQASGVMSILDIIQEGNLALVKAVDKLDWNVLYEAENVEKTLKSFFAKRIKGGIRRAIDINRGNIRLPEHKINEIRKNPKDQKMVAMFFNAIFLSTDEFFNLDDEEENMFSKLDDKTYIFDSKIKLQDFYRSINLKDSSTFDEISTEIETLGGLLIEKTKKIPRVGEIIYHNDYKFIIEIVDKKRIKQVKLILPK